MNNESIEQARDTIFFVLVGISSLIIGLVIWFFVSILPHIETLNPVGNLIIK